MFSSTLILCILGITFGHNWDYHHQDQWPGLCQTGKRQSPINIVIDKVTKFPLGKIEYLGYDKATAFKTTNVGHTVTFQRKSGGKPLIRGPLLGTDYILDQFHFHWSSEHTINGSRYDLEGHFVHYDKKYANLSEAVKHKNAIAVIAVLYEISTMGNKYFDQILKGASEVLEPNATSQIEDFVLSTIIPTDRKAYYTYIGSKTSPPCQEDIIWIIIKNQASISKEHVNQFSQIKDNRGNNIRRNYRNTQNLNRRGVLVPCN